MEIHPGDGPSVASKPAAEALEGLRKHLVRFLARRTQRDVALAEDLAQESLVRVLRALPQFRGDAALRTWAQRIAGNVWRDHMRRRAASPVERAAGGDAFSVSAILDTLAPGKRFPDPEFTADRDATHDCLLDAVHQLPLDRRRVVLLHDFAEMPLEEVAKGPRVLGGCRQGPTAPHSQPARRDLPSRV